MDRLPRPEAADLTAYLEASGAWTKLRMWRGGQIWQHAATGAQVAIPLEGRCADDDEILQQAATSVARIALGLSDGEAGFAAAIQRLGAAQQRIAELEEFGGDVLSRFVATGDGHRARVGKVLMARWQAILDDGGAGHGSASR